MADEQEKAEQARQQYVSTLESHVSEMRSENERLREENERLREVVGDYALGNAVSGIIKDGLNLLDWLGVGRWRGRAHGGSGAKGGRAGCR